MAGMGPERLGRLFDEHAPAQVLYARQWSDRPEDVVQDAFVALARQSRPPDRVVPWLYRVVGHASLGAPRALGAARFGLARVPGAGARRPAGAGAGPATGRIRRAGHDGPVAGGFSAVASVAGHRARPRQLPRAHPPDARLRARGRTR